MSEPIRFVVLGDPVSANRLWRKGKDGRIYKTDDAKDFQDIVGWMANEAGAKLIDTGDVDLTILYYHRYPEKRLDASNVVKCAEDALKGIVIKDDRQVRNLVVRRIHDPENPRMEFEIERTESD